MPFLSLVNLALQTSRKSVILFLATSQGLMVILRPVVSVRLVTRNSTGTGPVHHVAVGIPALELLLGVKTIAHTFRRGRGITIHPSTELQSSIIFTLIQEKVKVLE